MISATIEEQKTETIIDPSPSSEVEWKSMFRSRFRYRVLFKGMIEQFRWCSRQVTVAVEGVHSSAGDVAYGILTDGTCILTGEGGAPDQSDKGVIADGSIRSQKHLLVLGDRGCGKSYFLKKEAERDASNRNVYSINVEELPQGENSSVSTATVLHELLQKAKRSTPCTLVVDDLHLICNTKSSTAPWITAQLASSICDLLEDVRSGHLDIRLIASAVDRESLDPRLTSAENLGLCVTQLIPPATVQERVECMLHCFHDLQVEVTPEMRDEMERVAVNCHAFTPRDFFRLADTAVIHAVTECGSAKSVAPACITDAARKIRPSSLRQFDVSIPTVSWNDIGGSEEAKTVLRDVVSWCLGKQRWIFETFPISPPKGVLLYGPPGCSKTMLAKALAHESQLNFISIKGPEVFSKWVGDSEKAVRDIFTRARNAAPCIVFIDELDGMCGHRGGGGVSDRVISQFLTELDGLPSAFAGKSNALVFVAATNRPDSIDAAVLRPGRIDRCVYIGLPSTSERCAIVRIHFSRIPVDDTLTPEYVAEQTEGYTGAEVVAVVKEASLVAVSEEEDAQFLSRKHVDTALKKVRPRIKPEDVRWYKNWSTRK
ncbi:transitional endoplasmic reticulum ATPase [Angomonas deanei]|nr:transitional endoplasmic reticulum ATPase [Angomonas deanei]|eukprot:EPY28774.1 transitional endoplasmic reticulum ATPase [Angomonas deanei]